MFKFVRNKLLLIGLIVSLNACMNEIKFSDALQTGELVVNCILAPDSIVKANITYSSFFLMPEAEFAVAKDIEVKMYSNDVFKEILKFKSNNYVSIYRPKSGEQIKLTVRRFSTDKTAIAETKMPFTASIIGIDTVRTFKNEAYLTHDTLASNNVQRKDTLGLIRNFEFNFNIRFHDAADTVNFYRITATIRQTYSDGKSSSKKFVLYPNDEVIDRVAGASIFDANSDRIFNIFSDEKFSGKNYGVKLIAKMTHMKPTLEKIYYPPANLPKPPFKTELIIDLQCISYEYFEYLRTVKYNNTDLQYFSEPVQIFNNISNGLGLLGCATHAYFKINLPTSASGYYFQ